MSVDLANQLCLHSQYRVEMHVLEETYPDSKLNQIKPFSRVYQTTYV